MENRFTIALPDWVAGELPAAGQRFATAEERMEFAIRLALRNVAHETGGPFGAAVFDRDSGRLLAAGVNVVVPSRCSAAHAEIVALSLAQQTLRSYDLGAADLPRCELVTSAEPCAMCLGAVIWSGVTSLVCGARDADLRGFGFDEGPKPGDFRSALTERGIEVQIDVQRDASVHVLQTYLDAGYAPYNARSGGKAQAGSGTGAPAGSASR